MCIGGSKPKALIVMHDAGIYNALARNIQIKRGALEAAEGMVNIAKGCVGKVDTPLILDEYNQIVRKLGVEKYAS